MIKRFAIIASLLNLSVFWGCFPNKKTSVDDRNHQFIVENYEKHEYQIPMRDGVKLFTTVFSPKDKSKKYPILFNKDSIFFKALWKRYISLFNWLIDAFG
jgi:hypothetical protein